MIKIILNFILIMVLAYNSCNAQNMENRNNYILQVGEELTYIVKYAFINLGEVKIKVVDENIIDNEKVITVQAFIDSYEGLPFVSIHQLYESTIDTTLYPNRFLGVMFDEDTSFTEYIFSGDSTVKIKEGNFNTQKIKFDSTVSLHKRNQDGLSIFFYARNGFTQNQIDSIPCFVNAKQEITVLKYFTESEEINIDAVDYEIDCKRLEGETNFVSVYGLTGEFEGWFSNDKQSVPIVAKMNVIIGSVTLELINWNKELWNPPKYNN